MTDRREPTISPLAIDKDEPARARAQRAAPGGSPPPPVSSRPVVVRSPLGPFALLLGLVALGFAGFVYAQLLQTREVLQQTASQLTRAEGRVAELEQKLDASGDESSQSLAAMQANIRENASEIRKLWGVANDRNRKAIAELQTTATRLDKAIGGVDGKIKAALAEVSGDLKVVSELVDAQQALITNADRMFRDQQQAMTRITQKMEQLEDLRKKVSAHDEAIQSIDAFRLQVNRELLRMRGG